MSQQKRKAIHPTIKDYFCGKPKQKFLDVSQPERANASSSDCKVSLDSVAQEEQHSAVRILKASTVSANSQSAASNNKTFQSWIKLKGFDEFLLMNVFTLHADGGIICLLCSKHPVVTTGRGKNGNIYTLEPARPPRPYSLDNHLSSDQHQKVNSFEITQRISPFHVIHQDRISDKANTVAERVHLTCWVLKEEIANRKIASLKTLMDRIGHNDRLRHLRHSRFVAVTEFILLISEYLSNRIVSDVKQSPCWVNMVDEATNIAALCCPFHLPQPGQSKDFQLCSVLKPSKETGCLM